MRHSVAFGVLALTAVLGLSRGAVAFVDPGYSHGASGAMPSHGPQGYLGVDLREVNEDQVTTLKLKEPRGVEIVNVDHDGPACKAGLRIHDVILQMNGQMIEGVDQLKRMLRESPPGRTVSLLLSHDGQQQTVSVQLGNRETIEREAWQQRYKVPEPDPLPESSKSFGGTGFLNSGTAGRATKGMHNLLGPAMIVSSSFTGAKLEVMGPQLAEFFGAQGSAGLLVRSVDANSPAADAGLRAGDVVVKVNSISVVSGSDWTKTIHENRGHAVPVVVLRDKKEQTLTLTPDGKKRSSVEPGMELEEFFGGGDQAEQTREILAQLQPLFDSMAADARRRMEAASFSPEMAQMMARLEAFAADPMLRQNLETARKQVDAAADAARRTMEAAGRLRMN
jgi:membrane-associated protease RseP (regulator of RpoE activity)